MSTHTGEDDEGMNMNEGINMDEILIVNQDFLDMIRAGVGSVVMDNNHQNIIIEILVNKNNGNNNNTNATTIVKKLFSKFVNRINNRINNIKNRNKVYVIGGKTRKRRHSKKAKKHIKRRKSNKH